MPFDLDLFCLFNGEKDFFGHAHIFLSDRKFHQKSKNAKIFLHFKLLHSQNLLLLSTPFTFSSQKHACKKM